MVAYQIPVLEVVVRIHLEQFFMEFVAERLRRKFVALVNAGSNPVKLPLLDVVFNGSIRGLGPYGVSSNLAIQTKKAPSLA